MVTCDLSDARADTLKKLISWEQSVGMHTAARIHKSELLVLWSLRMIAARPANGRT